MSDLEINGTPIAKLRVVDLKNELDNRGLSKSGKKDELVTRLISYMEVHETSAEPKEAESQETESEVSEKGEGAVDTDKEAAEIEQAKREEEKLAEEAKIKKEKQAEQERLAEVAKIEKEKEGMEEEKRLKEVQRLEEEKQRKMEEVKKAEEELKLKEDRRRKDEEERQKLKQEQEELEEEKRKKDEDRKRMKDEAERKKKEEAEKKEKEKAAFREEEDKRKADQRAKDEKAAADRKIKWEKEQEERKLKEDKLKSEKDNQDEEQLNVAEKKESTEKESTPDATHEKEVTDNGINGKEDESLIIETAADDTLVMEIDQADMVAEEVSKEESESPMISAEPGQVTSLRKLGGSKSGLDASRKRGWGASKGATTSANTVSISSNSLKDLVPDIKPLMDTEATIEEEVEVGSVDSDADIAGPKIPDNVKKDAEPVKKRKRIPVTDLNETAVVLIVNLTRPFTVNQLKEMLKRTGTILDFWIDRIKSTCCVQFSTVDQASETRMALDGVTWPQGNPKTLRVTFSTEEQLKKYQESSTDALSRLGTDSNGRLGGVREWDKNKVDQEQDRAKEREKRLVREKERREGQEREKSVEKKPAAVKSLEDLFKKTVAGPAIYWKPLSEDQIKQKIEARNKKIMEAQIMREMMDTKESLQRSKKLLPARSPHD